MTLHHFTRQDMAGLWHCVYRTPGTETLTSVMEAGREQPCRQEADRLNRLQARAAEVARIASLAPADRPIPKGFYNDNDAA